VHGVDSSRFTVVRIPNGPRTQLPQINRSLLGRPAQESSFAHFGRSD